MVVNSDSIVYMCMDIIICQSDRSPERLMISQTPSTGGTSKHLRWEKDCGGNSPSFCNEFCKTLPIQNRIFLTFKIVELWTFLISVFVNTSNIVVKSYTVLYMCMQVMICQSERSPERLMISQTPSMGGHQITSGGRRNMEETLPAFAMSFAKPFLLKIGYS